MGICKMAPFKRDQLTGKVRVDWSALITLVLSFTISTAVGGTGAYIAVKSKIFEHDFRLSRLESDVNQYVRMTNEHIQGYSGDRKEIDFVCKQLDALSKTVQEIRDSQVKRYGITK